MKTSFDAGDLRRERRNDETLRLTGARVIEGSDPDGIQALARHLTDHEIRGGFRGSVRGSRDRGARFRRAGAHEPIHSAIHFGRADEDEDRLRAMLENRFGQVHRAVKIDLPCSPRSFARLAHAREGRKMNNRIWPHDPQDLIDLIAIRDIESAPFLPPDERISQLCPPAKISRSGQHRLRADEAPIRRQSRSRR